MPTVKQFKLPDVGEGLTEAEIVTWQVKPGDTVDGQRDRRRDRDRQVAGRAAVAVRRRGHRAARAPRARRSTSARRSSRSTTRAAGAARPAAAGAPPRGDLARRPGRAGGRRSPPGASGGGRAGPDRRPGAGRPDRGAGRLRPADRPRPRAARARARAAGVAAAAAQQAVQALDVDRAGARSEPTVEEPAEPRRRTPSSAAPSAPAVRVLAKPPVRKLAKDLGVDLATLAGTGAGGVDHPATTSRRRRGAAARAGPAAGHRPYATGAPVERRDARVPIKGVRKMMAAGDGRLGASPRRTSPSG